MENARGKLPYVFKILEDTLNKERKNLEFWNRMSTSDDTLVVRQAKSNLSSNQERVRQLEEVIAYLCPAKPEVETQSSSS